MLGLETFVKISALRAATSEAISSSPLQRLEKRPRNAVAADLFGTAMSESISAVRQLRVATVLARGQSLHCACDMLSSASSKSSSASSYP
jgi:hypothetical protein